MRCSRETRWSGRSSSSSERKAAREKIVARAIRADHLGLAPVILIADDSPTIRGFVRLVLRSLAVPFELIEVEDGAQAIAAARNTPPALALIDLQMPGTDGLAALRAMRADDDVRLRDLPIYLLTAERDEATRDACMAAGATGFIDKPIKPGLLIDTVRRVLTPQGTP